MSSKTMGVVTVGGGFYEAGAFVLAHMLREVSTLPLHIYHYPGKQEFDRRLVADLQDVSVIDAEWPGHGWATKAEAVDQCPFDQVWFLDSDVYPIAPLPKISTPEMFWPNVFPEMQTVNWRAFGLRGDGLPCLDGGIWYVDKIKRSQELSVYLSVNRLWSITYAHGCGDQDMMRVAWAYCSTTPNIWPGVASFKSGAVLHLPHFIHRFGNKMRFSPYNVCESQANTRRTVFTPDLPKESRVRHYFRIYKGVKACGNI